MNHQYCPKGTRKSTKGTKRDSDVLFLGVLCVLGVLVVNERRRM